MTIRYIAHISNQSTIENADLLSGVARTMHEDGYLLFGKNGVDEFVQGVRFNVESAWGACDFIKVCRIEKIETTETNYVTMNQVDAPSADSMQYITISLVRLNASDKKEPKRKLVSQYTSKNKENELPKRPTKSPKKPTDVKHLEYLEKCYQLLVNGKFTASHVGCIVTQGKAYLERTGNQRKAHYEFSPTGIRQYAHIKTRMARSLWGIPVQGNGDIMITIKSIVIETDRLVILAAVPYKEDGMQKELEVKLTSLAGVKW